MSSSNAFQLYLPPHPSATERSVAHWPSIKDYTKQGKLGEGGCAVVYRAKHKLTGTEVAIKKIQRTDDDTYIAGELEVLLRAKHENIVKFHEFLWSTDCFYFVLEFANRGNLLEMGALSEYDARMFFRQVVSGAEYLHRLNIAHLDFKPENILVTQTEERWIAKITDFGISKHPGDVISVFEGTPEYMAPELHLEKVSNGLQADLWSLGVTLYHMLTGQLPFHGKHAEDTAGLQRSITSGIYEVPDLISNQAKNLLQKFLQVDPRERHDLERLVEVDEWLHTM